MKKMVLFLIIIAFLFSGCDQNTPPSVEDVKNLLQDNADDVQKVLDFLKSSEYEDVIIMDSSGNITVFEYGAEFAKEINIKQESVYISICNLLEDEHYLSIVKLDKTIDFLQWTGIQDISCGAAYSIDESSVPDVEFMTEIVEMDNGWYYYVADYNKWRLDQG